MTVSHEDLVNLVEYFPDTGKVLWKSRKPGFYLKSGKYSDRESKRWNARYAGKVAGSDNGDGYLCVKIMRRSYKLHRLIWFLMTKSWPDNIDHINGVRYDNRWENLRNVSHLENNKNARIRKDNVSGCPGVSWIKQSNKWIAHIKVDGKQVILGYYVDVNDAIRVRKDAETNHGYHENHGDRYAHR